MYWSVIETNVGILAASIPSFKVIAKRYFPRLVGDYSSSRHHACYSGVGVSGHGSGVRGSRGPRSIGPFNKLEYPDSFVMKGAVVGEDLDGGRIRERDVERGEAKEVGVVRTRIGSGDVVMGGDRGSKERIVMPRGQIVAQTEITRHVEEHSDDGSY